MRTTLLPEAIHRRLRRLSADEGRALQKVHVDVIRLGLAAYAKKCRSRVGANGAKGHKNDTRPGRK